MLASPFRVHTIAPVTMNWLSTFLLLLLPVLALAGPSFSPMFTDGAVLQQGCNVPVWGRAEPGEHVTVSFQDQQIGATTDADGNWQVLLSPLTADASESELRIQGSTTLTLHRILVGEVWLCVVQGESQASLGQVEAAHTEASDRPLPPLRYMDLSTGRIQGPTPQVCPAWADASTARAPFSSFEAFFFARHLQRKIAVPIGIIQVSVSSGNPAAWLSPAAIKSNPQLSFIPQHWAEEQATYPGKIQAFQLATAEWKKGEQKAKEAGPAKLAAFHQKKHFPPEPLLTAPCAYFEQFLTHIVPYSLRGISWHETKTTALHAAEYEATLRALIQSTRAHFGSPALAFIIVQLGPQPIESDVQIENGALLRHAQSAILDIPNTQLVVSLDLGDAKSVHPFTPQELARRLGQTALGTIYNLDVEYRGPSVRQAVFEHGKLRVDFDHASTGLIAYKKPVQDLEVAGADGKFYPATALIHGSSLAISCPKVNGPQTIRYAWNKAPYANLANGAGLPAAPFVFQLIQGQVPPAQ